MEDDNRPYYAVRRGHVPGIYRTWDEAEEQVHGHPRPRHKKYFRRENAEAFMRGENPDRDPPRPPSYPDRVQQKAFRDALDSADAPEVDCQGGILRIYGESTAIPYVLLL